MFELHITYVLGVLITQDNIAVQWRARDQHMDSKSWHQRLGIFQVIINLISILHVFCGKHVGA